MNCPAKSGRVVLVGTGPGDSGLITAAGAKWLSKAEVVVYDRLVSPALVRLTPGAAERVYVGKAPGGARSSPEKKSTVFWWIGARPACAPPS